VVLGVFGGRVRGTIGRDAAVFLTHLAFVAT